MDVRSFVTIGAEKEGLIYKNPLPNDGMIISGSKIITERFGLWGSLDKKGSWALKIDWSIYPPHM